MASFPAALIEADTTVVRRGCSEWTTERTARPTETFQASFSYVPECGLKIDESRS